MTASVPERGASAPEQGALKPEQEGRPKTNAELRAALQSARRAFSEMSLKDTVQLLLGVDGAWVLWMKFTHDKVVAWRVDQERRQSKAGAE